MDRKRTKVHRDQAIAELAEGQHGVVSRDQLRELGLSVEAIEGRLRRGRLHRVHQGVYSVGRPSVHGTGLLVAALLACGERAVLSHRSAAAVWCIRPSASRRVEVTAPDRRRRVKGILVHRNQLDPGDTTEHEEIPVTTPGRTLVDLADVLSRRALERAFDEAEHLRLDCSGLTPVRGREGYGRLLHVLEHHEPGSTRTRSRLEERFLELCEAHGLPRPLVNTMIDGKEVDFRFGRLIVEVDGEPHRTKRAFESDRARDAELAVLGYRVIRVTETRMERAPGEVAAQVRTLSDVRPTTMAPSRRRRP
jgi:hypothetical protein